MTQTPQGDAMMEVALGIAQAFFRMRAAGRGIGAVSPWGAGLWGMLRSLKLDGPQTVPQIARARPVARQRIQKLANEMAADGVVEFVDNPAHRRSKLVRLTPKGEALYEDLTARVAAICETLAADLDADDLRTTARTLGAIRDKLAKL